MSYLPKSKPAEPASDLLTGAAVRADRSWEKGDFSDWMELMEAVEALCPVWPERQWVTQDGAVYKL